MWADDNDRRIIVKGGKAAQRRRATAVLEAADFQVISGESETGLTAEIGDRRSAAFAPGRTPDWSALEEELRRAAKNEHTTTALLLVNLDHFKRVRAMLGGDQANLLLREVAARLKLLVEGRSPGKQGGRLGRLLHLGSDEFAVLLPDVGEGEVAGRIGHEILHMISRPYEMVAPQVYLTGRVGIALYPHDGQGIETLRRHAASVLHHESRQGRNSVRFYATGMADVAAERFELEAELSRAIHNGEFEVHYQPQFSLTTGAIVGAEALVRWRRPGIGAVPAEVFVAVAEDLGLIADLGNWVLTTAAAECRRWQEAGHGRLRVSINTSAYQFRRLDMREVVSTALEKTGLDPSCLMLEVTESLVLADVERTLGALSDLQQMGVRIALDDFGTGYSSLSYLKNFAVDSLKIDRSFVKGLPEDHGDLAVTEAIIRIAKALHLEVTAEGVETEQQRACLAALGCDDYQGFLASPPVPAADMLKLLAAVVS